MAVAGVAVVRQALRRLVAMRADVRITELAHVDEQIIAARARVTATDQALASLTAGDNITEQTAAARRDFTSTFQVDTTGWSRDLAVDVGGRDVINHAGAAALRLIADGTGLTAGMSRALARRGFTPVHDRGRVLADTAVLIADGGRVMSVPVRVGWSSWEGGGTWGGRGGLRWWLRGRWPLRLRPQWPALG